MQVQRDAVDAVKKAQGFVIYDLDLTNSGPNPSPDSWVPEWLGGGKSWAPKWLIDRVGVDYFGTVIEATLRPSRVNDPCEVRSHPGAGKPVWQAESAPSQRDRGDRRHSGEC